MRILITILLALAACEPCRQNGATAADEPGLIAIYCENGAFDCVPRRGRGGAVIVSSCTIEGSARKVPCPPDEHTRVAALVMLAALDVDGTDELIRLVIKHDGARERRRRG